MCCGRANGEARCRRNASTRFWPDGSRRIPDTRCPHCGYVIDAATTLDGEPPAVSPGDLTVCFGCGEALTFDATLHLTKITARARATLSRAEQRDLRNIQTAIRKFLASEQNRSTE